MKKHLPIQGILAASTVSLMLAGPALAAEPQWTGFKLNVGGGANVMTAKQKTSTGASSDFNCSGGGGSGCGSNVGDGHQWVEANSQSDLGKAKGFATIELGLDKQFGSANRGVIGLTANYDFGKTRAKQSFAGTGYGEYWIGTYASGGSGGSGGTTDSKGYYDGVDHRTEVKLGDAWGVGLRLGALSEDRTALYYVTGGYARAKITQSSVLGFKNAETIDEGGLIGSAAGAAVGAASTSSQDKSGYFVGAGVEKRLSESVGVKFEYRYADYGTVRNNSTAAATGGFDLSGAETDGSVAQSAKVTNQSLRVLLTYSF